MKFDPKTGEPISSGDAYSGNDDDYTVVYNRNQPGTNKPGNGISNQSPYMQNNGQNTSYGQGSAQSNSYGSNNAQNYPYGQNNIQNNPYGQNNGQNYSYGQNNGQNYSYGQNNDQQNYSYGQNNGQQNYSYGQNTYPGNSGQGGQYSSSYDQPYPGVPGPTGSKKKPRKILLPIIIACAAICVLVGVFLIAKNLLLKPGDEILLAAANTAKGNQLAGVLTDCSKEFEKASGYSTDLDLSMSYSGSTVMSLKGTGSIDYSKKIISVKGNALTSESGNPIGANFYMDGSTFQLQVPDTSKYKLVYNYTTAANGEVITALCSQYGITTSALNSIFSNIWKAKDASADYQKQVISVTREKFNSLDWKKTEKETFTFNDKEVKAKGYTAVLTPSEFDRWVAEYKKIYENYIRSTLSEEVADAFGISASDLTSSFDNISIDENLTINVYLYKSKIVGLSLKYGNQGTIDVAVEGGAYPLENVIIRSDGGDSLELHGKTNGDVENMSLSFYSGQEAFSYTYNKKSGALSINAGGTTIDAVLKKDKDDLTLEFNSPESSYSVGYNMSIRVSPKVSGKSSQPSGTEINLNTASMEDFYEFGQELANLFY